MDLVKPKLFMKVSPHRLCLEKEPLTDFNNFYRYKHFSKLQKFVISDEGLPCVNTIETVYLALLVTVFAFGIVSLFRLTYFKAELRKLFDPREGCTLKLLKQFMRI